jgi:chromosome segregation ATPase
MDDSASIYSVEESASSSPAPILLDCHAQDRLREINQLIDDLEVATEGAKEGLERELGEVRGEKEGLERELGEVRGEKEGLERELGEVRGEKEGLERELGNVREESELLLLQLHQVQEELEHYFLEANQLKSGLEVLGIRKRAEREAKESLALKLQQKLILLDDLVRECKLKDEKLAWLGSQRQLLIDLVKYQFNVFGRFADLNLRFKLSNTPGRTRQLGGLAGLQGILSPCSPNKQPKVNKQVR